MKKTISIILSIFFSIALLAGDKETRSLKSFDAIRVSSGISATLIKSNENKIDIEATGIDLNKIETKVSGDELNVKIDQSWWKMGWNSKRKVNVVIYYTESLSSIESSSGSYIESDEIMDNDRLSVDAASGSKIELEVNTEKLQGDVSSGSTIVIDGTATIANIDASSGSSFRGSDLSVEDANLEASSGSSIKIKVSDKLKAEASSGASIKYGGNPSNTSIDKSSGGSVHKM